MADTANHRYPQGVPFRAPLPAARKPGRSRLLVGVLGGAVLVAVTAGATALVINLTAPRSQAVVTGDAPGPGAARPAVPVPAKNAAAGKSVKERFLEALGGLSAAHVYQSYLNIGLLADGVESEAYSKAEAEQMLATVGNMIDMADRQLDK